MKQFSVVIATLFVALIFVLASCKKEVDPIYNPPKPTPPQVKTFLFVLDSLPGLPKEPVANLFAFFSVVNDKNEIVIRNKKLPLRYDGKFSTDMLELPSGNYRVNKFFLVSGTNNIEFVTPMANSARAHLVENALPFAIKLPQPETKVLVTEVIRINAGDKSEDFGYPPGLFDGNPDTSTEVRLQKTIRLRTEIRIGNIMYDSIPASLMYRTWDANQDLKTRFINLLAGTNTLKLDTTAVKHELTVTKWGQKYPLILLDKDIHDDELFVFGESKAAKQLKSELTYKLVNGKYVAESKSGYEYNGNNQLNKISYFKKRADGSPYLAMIDEYNYSNARVSSIKRFDESNANIGSTTFTYNAQGYVSAIREISQNGEISASLNHNDFPGTGLRGVEFYYQYSHTSVGMHYYQRYDHGNLKEDNSVTDNHSTEGGVYTFDNNINPFIHIGFADLYLSNQSKNNTTSQVKSYYGNYPVTVAYGYAYKYDEEGYPIELIRNYRSYTTGEFLYTTKTVYLY